jgi:hypothetical protein
MKKKNVDHKGDYNPQFLKKAGSQKKKKIFSESSNKF